MRHLSERCGPVDLPYACLRMDFDQRQKVRSRVLATNGEFVGVHIQRGSTLKDGDHLLSGDGKVFVVRAKREPLSVVDCEDPQVLARAAYHLGNRHVRVQVEQDRVAYQADHVIDDMLEQLGLQVSHAELPFEPEPGAYHKHGGAASEEASHHPAHGDHGHEHHPALAHGEHGHAHDPLFAHEHRHGHNDPEHGRDNPGHPYGAPHEPPHSFVHELSSDDRLPENSASAECQPTKSGS